MLTANQMLLAYPVKQKEAIVTKPEATGDTLTDIKNIPIKYVLESLGVEVNSNNFIIEDGEVTSASVNEKGNYINRFSGREGSGSTIDAVMAYGKKDLKEAIDYLDRFIGQRNLDSAIEKVLTTEEPYDKIDDVTQNPFTWGTDELDKCITPIECDTFAIIAGETSVGKTQYSFDTAVKNAQLGHKVLYLSLEMSTDSILTRIAREYASINKEKWRNKRLISETQVKVYKRKKAELKGIETLMPVGMGVGIEPTVKNIFAIIEKTNPDIVFIDNFDLIQKDGATSEVRAETNTANKILDFAKNTPKPIILIHHLNKGKDKDSNKIRGINSLRGSGKISHNADMVIICYRKPYDENMTDEEKAMFTVMQIKDREFGVGGGKTIYFYKGTFLDNHRSDIDIAKNVFNI